MARSPRIVPGSASRALVMPHSNLTVFTQSVPSQQQAIMGVRRMNFLTYMVYFLYGQNRENTLASHARTGSSSAGHAYTIHASVQYRLCLWLAAQGKERRQVAPCHLLRYQGDLSWSGE